MTNRIRNLSLLLIALWGVSPARAQVDLSGYWANRPHEDNMARGPGLEPGEYEGYPINIAGRMKAQSWDAAVYSNPERQCIPLDVMTANSGFRMWKEVDPVSQEEIAWHLRIDYESQERIIWMDARPQPSDYAAHTFQGFSTGKWVKNQLVVTTTHLKHNMIERNGIPRSDAATIVEHFLRRDDLLTVVHIVYDPVYLEEPFIQTRDFALDIYARVNPSVCVPVDEIANRPKGYVPHYLPGKNPLLRSATNKYNVPEEAVLGGGDTAYPEFQSKLRNRAARAESRPRPAPVPLALLRPPAEILAIPVQGSVYMLVGAGANTTMQVGENGVYVVDPQLAPLSEKLLAAIREISTKRIRYIINTNADPDHIGGNEPVSKAGVSLGSTGGGGPQFAGNVRIEGQTQVTVTPAPIFAHENVLRKVSAPTGARSDVPTGAWPTETYLGKDYRLFNSESIQIISAPAAHSDGDSIVLFQSSNVISAGDIFSTITYPLFDRQRGGSINGVIAGLNQIIDLCTPRHTQEGGTYVIPGHGRLSDVADVVEYRDMATIIRDRIADQIKRGLTLDQVKAEQPTLDYDTRYAAPGSAWTRDNFLEAVYQDLSSSR